MGVGRNWQARCFDSILPANKHRRMDMCMHVHDRANGLQYFHTNYGVPLGLGLSSTAPQKHALFPVVDQTRCSFDMGYGKLKCILFDVRDLRFSDFFSYLTSGEDMEVLVELTYQEDFM